MASPIIFVTKAPHHFQFARDFFSRRGIQIPVFFGKDDICCKEIIEAQVREGSKVIITFDYLSDQFSQSFSVPFALIRRSPATFIKIIMDILQVAKKVALVYHNKSSSNSYYVRSMRDASKIFDNHTVSLFGFKSYQHAEDVLLSIKQQGFNALLGPHNLAPLAEKLGFSYYTVPLSESDLLDAVEQAQYHLRLYDQHIQNETLVNAILDLSDQGTIALDGNGYILHINQAAKSIFSLLKQDPTGQYYGDTSLASIDAIKEVQKDKKSQKSIVKINGDVLMCNLTPLFVDGSLSNIIISCELADHIQEKDISVRSRLLSNKRQATKTFRSIVGNGEKISRAVATARRYAYYDSTILISAPSGCGKEVFAQSIHNVSRRKDRPFVVINCAALPESILESLLFGYEAGTFTGAKSGGKVGLFELAHGGTVFLDEISEMPLVMQSRFLRVLQEHEVMRIGSDQPIPVDIRIIAATNRDLWEMVQKSTFREDLYYRISVLLLKIPPLDERKEDIPQLSHYFLSERSSQLHIPTPILTDEAIEFLKLQSFRGNVRQLNNILERAMILSPSPIIDADMLKQVFEGNIAHQTVDSSMHPLDGVSLSESISYNESNVIQHALEKCSGNRQQTAAYLGISVSTLWRKMKQYNL